MKIKLKIRRFGHPYRHFRNEKTGHDGLSPEKQRKLEELALAREGRISQTDVQEKPAMISPKPASVSVPKKYRFCGNMIEWGIIGLLVFSPLPAASVHKWSVLLIQLTVFVMFGAYILMAEKPRPHPQLSSAFKWPRYLFIALFVLIAAQMIPWPNFLIKSLSPSVYSFRALFSPNFASAEFTGLSLIPAYTFQKGLELLAYFLLGYLIVKTVRGRHQMMRILYVMVGMAIFQALYGFFELYNRNPRILFYEKTQHFDCVTGTFMNRNHLSGYLEMIIPIAIGIVLARTEFFNLSGLSWKAKLLQLTEKKVIAGFLIPGSIIVMALAIIFSKSRSGIFLLVLTFLLIFEFSVLHFQRSSYRKKMISRFLKVTFLIVTILALYIGIDGIIKRFSMERLLHEYRPVFWSHTVQIIEDFPLFGSGLGTFASLYPAYAKTSAPVRLSHAHNDYLEYLSELGLFGLIFLLGGILLLLGRAFLVWRKRQHPYVKGLGLGGFIAVILLLLHSITDFNLHIPANMILFTVVLSLTVVTVFYQKSELDPSGNGETTGKDRISVSESGAEECRDEMKEWEKFIDQGKRSVFKEAGLFVSAVFLAIAVIAIFWNSYFYNKGKSANNNSKKISILKRANMTYPMNDLVHLEMGKANYSLGSEMSEFDEVQIAHLHESVEQFATSLRINPLSGIGHFFLGKSLWYLSSLGPENQKERQNLTDVISRDSIPLDSKKRAHEEYKKAVLLAGSHNMIYMDVGKTYLLRWNELSIEDKNFTIDFLEKTADRIEKDEFLELLDYWEKYVRDYSVMDSILPDYLRYLRMYADFLGERSLSSRERHRYMVKVEAMRFNLAREEFRAGENAFMYRKIRKARGHFLACQKILRSLRFYQNLTENISIDLDDYRDLKKSIPWMLARCGLMERQDFKTVQSDLERYVELENDEVAVGNLEDFLKQRNLIGERLKSDFDDLSLLAFHLSLILKQRRYTEVISAGRDLESYLPRTQVSEIKSFIKLMRLVGDALMRIEYFSDAGAFYRKALAFNPVDLEILIRLRECYDRAGDETKVRESGERIERLLSLKERRLGDLLLGKGEIFSRVLKLDGEKRILKLSFRHESKDIKPLITVCINDRVVWEDYLGEEILSLPLDSLAGENKILVTPVNTGVVIRSIAYR